MSSIFQRMDAVCELDLPRADKAVFKRLTERANPANQFKCWPAIKSICKDTGYSPRTVQAALRRLEDNNFITRKFRTGKSSKFHVHPHLGLIEGYKKNQQKVRHSPAKSDGDPGKSCGETEKNKNLNHKGVEAFKAHSVQSKEARVPKNMIRPAAPSVGHLASKLLKGLPLPPDPANPMG
ncbi:MAG: helix-turn-helix domain-containing protein [Marinomonas sp.]